MRFQGKTAMRAGLPLGIGALILFLPAACNSVHGKHDYRKDAEYEALIVKLEKGMVALEDLDEHNALQIVDRVADDVRAERQEAREKRGGRERDRESARREQRESREEHGEREREGEHERANPEREGAKRELEVLRLAFKAFMEADMGDAADRIEHAIHARELGLAGRRDEEAQHVRETAPPPRELAGLLKRASRLWAEWGHEEQATLTGGLARRYAQRSERTREAAASREDQAAHDGEREFAMRLVKALRLTEKACREADRPDAGDLAKHAYRALEMQLEGRRDEEARHYIENAPPLAEKIELLHLASELWADWGHEDPAAVTGEMARTLKEHWNQSNERERKEAAGELESLEHRIEILRFARDAFRRVRDEKNMKALNRAIHYGELLLTEAPAEAVLEAVEGVPSKGNLIELLQHASAQYREWGHEDRARACHALAERYSRDMREESGEGEGREERAETEGDLDDLEYRIEIIRWSRGALAEAGAREKAAVMEKFLHGAELQLVDAPMEERSRIIGDLDLELIIDLFLHSAELYADWGWEGRARECHRLAEFYVDRWNLGGEERREGGEEAHVEEEMHERYHALLQRVDEIQAELDEVRAHLHQLLNH